MNEHRVKKMMDDKAYLERALLAVTPKILRAMTNQAEKERQRSAAARVKAMIKEIDSRKELIESFRPLAESGDLSSSDRLMLRVYGCSSFKALIEELEKQNEAFFQVIYRLSSWLPFSLRDMIEDWIIGNISTKAVLAAMPGRA
ncbi:MAG: hypothetical protein IKT97_07780 [Spirochaetia bacterium]|nr:hypothetical protein [Spirochaetia bacterium]